MAISVSDLPPKYQAQALKKWMEQQQRQSPSSPPPLSAAPPYAPGKKY